MMKKEREREKRGRELSSSGYSGCDFLLLFVFYMCGMVVMTGQPDQLRRPWNSHHLSRWVAQVYSRQTCHRNIIVFASKYFPFWFFRCLCLSILFLYNLHLHLDSFMQFSRCLCCFFSFWTFGLLYSCCCWHVFVTFFHLSLAYINQYQFDYLWHFLLSLLLFLQYIHPNTLWCLRYTSFCSWRGPRRWHSREEMRQ